MRYLVLLVVFSASIWIGSVFPVDSVLSRLSAIPLLGSLCAALLSLWRDHLAEERASARERTQQAFTIAATSHMAITAFNKHVEFCEKYLAEVNRAIDTMYSNGPSEEVLIHARQLARIRIDHAAWLTNDIEKELEPFEAAIRRIGANSSLVNALRGTADPTRGKAIKEMYAEFKNLLGLSTSDADSQDSDVTILAVQAKIRTILGIEKLASMRAALIDSAFEVSAK